METSSKEFFYLPFITAFKGDETLDYRVAKKKLEGANMIIEEGGSHAFDGFENHLKDIEQFFDI